jgi:RND family efflux transporter MFP subunit
VLSGSLFEDGFVSVDDKSSQLHRLRIDRAAAPERRGVPLGWLAGAVAALAAGGAGAWFLWAQPAAVPVHTALAQKLASDAGPAVASLLDASGYVVARRQATVSAKITGKVVEVLIEEGQHVEKDQIVGLLDDSNTRAALDQAQALVRQSEAQLNAARVALTDARPTYERNEKLAVQGWVSHGVFDTTKANYDTLRTACEVAAQAVTVAMANLTVAQRNEDDTIVKAPFAGVITVKAAQPGEIVSPISAGGGFTRTGIGTIVDMDSLEVEVDVNENFINRVHGGQDAMVKLNAYPDWQIPAQVIAVIPTADRAKATVKVRVGMRLKDPRILPEMGARVAFLSEAPAVASGTPLVGVSVPAAAVQTGADGTGAVFVIHGDRLERRAVRLGIPSADRQTVLAGLTPGERVAIGDDGAKLAEDTKIRIED